MKTIEPYTPIQYVMGKAEFRGLDFVVNEDVLIPRPETEGLVEAAIDSVQPACRSGRRTAYSVQRLRILDLGTGSGNIAIALTKKISDCKIVASDISDAALKVAKVNAKNHGVWDRIEFVQSDLFEEIKGEFDLIVSNPPYIAGYEFATLQEEVLREPRSALDGGADGLDFYRRIFDEAKRFLKSAGHIIVEIGFGQRIFIEEIIRNTKGFEISKVIKDHNGIDRIIIAKWIN